MFQDQEKSLPVNDAERNVANIVYNIIISSINDRSIYVETEEFVYYDDTYEPYDDIPADDLHEDINAEDTTSETAINAAAYQRVLVFTTKRKLWSIG